MEQAHRKGVSFGRGSVVPSSTKYKIPARSKTYLYKSHGRDTSMFMSYCKTYRFDEELTWQGHGTDVAGVQISNGVLCFTFTRPYFIEMPREKCLVFSIIRKVANADDL